MTKIINIFNSSSGNNAKTGEIQVGGFNVDPTTITATVPESKSTGTISLDAGASGRIDSVTVNGVGMLSNAAVAATGTFTVDTSITEGIHALNVFTSTGAQVPGVYAENVLTSTGTNPAEDETVTIDATVYKWRDTLASAYDVKIAGTAALTLDNLKAAINASGTEGVEYFAGTNVHPTVIASTNTDTTQKVVARTIGTGSNGEATTETSSTTSWADTTLGGGTGASVTGVVTTSATVTIDATVYTSVTSLAETHGLADVAFQVLWVTNEATYLDNLKSAINLGGTIGTDYATGTTAHPTVVATTNTATAQTIIAKLQGTASNGEATTDTLANYTWADTTLGGGTGASITGVAGDTVTIDSTIYTFVDTLSEDHATAIANQVLWVTSDAVALDNFKSAINLSGSIGTDYSTGTSAHSTVTATTNGAATQVVAAQSTGYAGNSIATTETGSTLSWGAATLVAGKAANSVPFNSTLDQTATDLAANIDANDTTPNYASAAVTDTVTLTVSDEDLGESPNDFAVVVVATTITATAGNMTGGIDKVVATPTRTRQNKADYWSIAQTSASSDEFDLPFNAAIGEVITLYTVSAFELRTEVDGEKINDVVDKGYQTTAGDIVRCVKVGAASWIVSSLTLEGAAVTITAGVAAS